MKEPSSQDDVDAQDIPDSERLSWAAYFGAATGLVVGIVTAALIAEALHVLWPAKGLAEVFWTVASPILALLGLILGGFGFHRLFKGRMIIPGLIFIIVLAVGMCLVFRPEAFAWHHRASESEASGGAKP